MLRMPLCAERSPAVTARIGNAEQHKSPARPGRLNAEDQDPGSSSVQTISVIGGIEGLTMSDKPTQHMLAHEQAILAHK